MLHLGPAATVFVADIESDVAIVAKQHETAKEDHVRAVPSGKSWSIEQR
jgi:hypothetical protein